MPGASARLSGFRFGGYSYGIIFLVEFSTALQANKHVPAIASLGSIDLFPKDAPERFLEFRSSAFDMLAQGIID